VVVGKPNWSGNGMTGMRNCLFSPRLDLPQVWRDPDTLLLYGDDHPNHLAIAPPWLLKGVWAIAITMQLFFNLYIVKTTPFSGSPAVELNIAWIFLPYSALWLLFSRRESWIFNNCGVTLTLIHWLGPPSVLPWWSEPTLATWSEGLAKDPY